MTAAHDLIRGFFAAMSRGQVPDDLTTPDMTAWTLSGGAAEKSRFAGGVALLQSLFDGGLTYTVEAIVAEGDRAAAQVQSTGTFTDGEPFVSNYAFLFTLADGRIAAVREYADVALVREKIGPRIQAAMAACGG